LPASQEAHVDAPALEYVPASQEVHVTDELAPVALEYVPAVQEAHVADDALEYVPATQEAHVDAPDHTDQSRVWCVRVSMRHTRHAGRHEERQQ